MKTFIKLGMLLSSLMLGNQAFAAHSCTATPSNTGGTFFQVDISITNTGTTALTGWTITLNFPETVTVTNAFNSAGWRSEEHTSELQSQSNLVCRLLLEKKKKKNKKNKYDEKN